MFSLFCSLLPPADPESTAVVRLSRAEAYMALKQYHLALEDTEFCPQSSNSAEVGHRHRSDSSSRSTAIYMFLI